MKIEWRRTRITRQDRVDQIKTLLKSRSQPERWTDPKGRTWLIYFHLEGLHTTPADTGPVGSFDVLGVTIISEDGRTLPFSFFREIPLATIWETVRRREAEDAQMPNASERDRLLWQPIADLYIAEAKTGRRGRRYDIDHYREVARLYDEAVSRGEHPTRFVADKLHLSRSAAAKQVSVARNDYGLLPRTQQGRSSTADRRTAE